jgi:uncharacterized damage-inducible protein DinB
MISTLNAAIRSNQSGNQTVLDALRERGGQPQAALAAFQHVLETELRWTRRMHGDSTPVPLWGPPSLEQCEQWLTDANAELDALAARLSEEELARTFSYQRSQGDAYTNTVGEALLHMLLHSAQYRGEAMGFLNAEDAQVPDTDFIFFLRRTATS